MLSAAPAGAGLLIRAALNRSQSTIKRERVAARHRDAPSLEQANLRVWQAGVGWVFETTLGGRTITDLLLQATQQGIAVRIWCSGLNSAEKHIERVGQRVARGGHDIPEDRIHYRYVTSLKNICRLM